MRNKLQEYGLIAIGLIAGILISLNFSASAEKNAPPPLPVEELRSFADVYSAIKRGYVEPIDDKKLITYAISGMLANLDPHSQYMDADSFKELQVSTQGEFGGLGIEVGMEDGFVKVVSPIEDTPAFKAGVQAGDLIIKLDDTPVRGMTLNDAVKRMRGKPKTSIVLTIARKNETKPIVLTIVRDKIKVQSVKSKTLEPGFGYLRVTQFQEETVADLVKNIDKLYKPEGKEGKERKEPLRGLVLDLRNDPGGLLNSAVAVAAAFLPPKALVVSTDGRTEDAKHQYLASPEHYLRGTHDDPLQALPPGLRSVPLVVLVNGGSASASEIVAGALQDHKRAVVLGTQTFGKGSVQTVLPLSGNTAIKLTTARYYTPSGNSIQAKGITPDVIVDETASVNPYGLLREADLDRHLGNDKDKDARTPEAAPKSQSQPPAKNGKSKDNRSENDSEEDARRPPEFASKNDRQLNQALSLLKAWPVIQRTGQAVALTPAASLASP